MGVTQNEIAKITGHSRSTVGTILAGKFAGNYSEETQREVLEAARRLNYRPNRQALTLKTGKSGVIGIVHTGSILPLTHQKIAEAVRVIVREELEPLVFHNTWFENSARITDSLLANRVQGVILINNYYDDQPQDLERLVQAVPVVQLGGYKAPGVPLVVPDKAAAVRLLARHLVKLGHRRVFMMSVGPEDSPMINPVSAFRKAFQSPGLRGVEHEVVEVFGEPQDRVDVFAPGKRLFERLRPRLEEGPAAVVVHNDNHAIGLYLQCMAAGVRVPEDLAMTGWDNVILGSHLPAPLTTVEQPVAEMAERAMEILLQEIRTPEAMEFFPCRVLIRASCGANR